jgi:hypothetical protein
LIAGGKAAGPARKTFIHINNGLEAMRWDTSTTFNFVITSSLPFTSTDLTAKISFSRVVLAGGKLADVGQAVAIATQ